MQQISDAIQQGAEAYLARQYKTISVLAILVAVVIGVGYGFFRAGMASDPVNDVKVLALYITGSFLLGAISSGIAGYVGMWVSIRTNIRTAAAATESLNGALQTALRGGAVSGLFTVAMSLLGVGGLFAIIHSLAPADMDAAEWTRRIPYLIVGYGHFEMLVIPTSAGHVGVGFEVGANPTDYLPTILSVMANHGQPAV